MSSTTLLVTTVLLIIGLFSVIIRAAPAESGDGNESSINLRLKSLKDELDTLTMLLRQLQQKLATAQAEAAAVVSTTANQQDFATETPVDSSNPVVTTTTPTDPITTSNTNLEDIPTTVRSPADPLDQLNSTEPTLPDPVATSTSDPSIFSSSSTPDPVTTSTSDPVASSSSSTPDPVTTSTSDPLTSSSSSTPDPVTTSTSDPLTSSSSSTPDPVTTSTSDPVASSSSSTPDPVTTSTSDPVTSSSSSTPDPVTTSSTIADPTTASSPPPDSMTTIKSTADPMTTIKSVLDPMTSSTSDPITTSSSTMDPVPPPMTVIPSTDTPTTPKGDENDELPQPMTRLYAGPNLTGMHEDINLGQNSQDCMEVKKLSSNIKSLDTFGSCVRLYQLPDCEGSSMAYYPMTKMGSLDTKESFLKTARSVGGCLENELDGAQKEMNPDGTKSYRKLEAEGQKPLVPDFINLGDDNSLMPVPNGGPVKRCRLGKNNRVEAIQADVRPQDLRNGPPNFSRADQDFYAKLEKEKGDQMGQFVGSSFGPPSQGLPFRNCFPQSPRNREMMQKLEGQAMNWLNGGGGGPNNERRVLTIRIFVDYGQPNSTRPTGFTCLMNGGGGGGGGGNGGRFRRMAYVSNLTPVLFVRSPLPFRIITHNSPPYLPPPYFRIVVPNTLI